MIALSYCLSINTYEGLVLCASSFVTDHSDIMLAKSSMQRFVWPGNRFITLLSSGNQQTIDGVLNQVRQDINTTAPASLLTTHNLNQTADYIAEISVNQQKALMKAQGKSQSYDANFIVAGQIINKQMETLLVYAQGNYIHEPNASPFLQIGEIKYGKPILDRIIKRTVPLNLAAHCALVSVDSSIRSNNAKMQTELMIYKKDSLEMSAYLLLDERNDFFKNISSSWDAGIIDALENLPRFYWEL